MMNNRTVETQCLVAFARLPRRFALWLALTAATGCMACPAFAADETMEACARMGGDAGPAIAACTALLTRPGLDPATVKTAYNNRGTFYLQVREYDRAIADFSEALRINTFDYKTYYNRANAYYGKREIDRMIADLTTAIFIDPRFTPAYISRGAAYTVKHDYDRAKADYDEAVRLDPKNATAYANRAHLFGERGELDRAIADASEAIRLDPSNGVAYNNRGTTFIQMGDRVRALQDLETACRLNASNDACEAASRLREQLLRGTPVPPSTPR